MGGRGSSSKSSKGGAKVMSEDEYLGTLGLDSPISNYSFDKTRLPHGETQRQRDKRIKEAKNAARNYQQKRSEAKAEYKKMLDSGQVRPPTRIESLMKTAKGSSDNQSVQAARRALQKRGYDWKTGKKL